MTLSRFGICCLFALGSVAAHAGEPHWAFAPLVRPSVPAGSARAPVDAFILDKLAKSGLGISSEADRRTLIRRLSFDLLGLPPTLEEVAAFLADSRPDAVERLADRILASPHFGERWGRHWLDGAGFVDVNGGDNDATIIKFGDSRWLYRDYVIRAFNQDKPFDRFLTEQIAGDEITDWRTAAKWTPEMREHLIATGFLRTAADDTDENELNTPDIRHGVVQRTAEVLANNLLGLTLNCAKCHDHKYEPISQLDYYRFQALLHPALNPDHWLQPTQRLLPDVPTAVKAARVLTAVALGIPPPPWKNLHVIYDTGSPTPTRLLVRGNHETPGEQVAPGFLRVLSTSSEIASLREVQAKSASSGRRLALVRWLTDAKSPAGSLVLRVRVNRVWQHLFGRGLVETSDNFGVTGAKPSHPELLDWLACEFAANGQRLKPLLHLLVTSAAYRQASASSASGASIDPDNHLLWRMPLKRMESEVVRDALLAVSGRLDRSVGGPPVAVDPKPDGSFVPKPTTRRSVYLLARRNYHPTFMNAFDHPNLATNCTRRASPVVVSQALALLNDTFAVEQGRAIAERIAKQTPPENQVELAFQLILGRPAEGWERDLCRDYLRRQTERHSGKANDALAHLCQTLFNTSEFLFVP